VKYLAILALIPFALGLNLQTGQNFFGFKGLNDGSAAFYGLGLELLAFVLVVISTSRYAKAIISIVFILQAPLLICWGILVGMFSGAGDGASRGAGPSDVLPWFLSGIVYVLIGIYTIRRILKSGRTAKETAVSQ
jgi:hypothetical protein